MNLRLSSIAASAALMFAAVPAHSATICVNPNSTSCSLTIQAGVTAASAGDTVSISSGFYNENVVVPVALDGLIIKGGKSAILDGDAPLGGVGITIDAPNVTVTGFTIQNGDDYGIEINADGALVKGMVIAGVDAHCILVGANAAIIEGNRIRGCSGDGISGAGDDIDIVNNKISKVGDSAVDVDGDGIIVEKNTIAQTSSNAVIITGDDVEVVGNKFIALDSRAVDLDGDNALVTGNKLSDTYSGFSVTGANPVFTKNRGKGVQYDAAYVDCAIDCSSAMVSNNGFSNAGDGVDLNANAPGMLVEKNSVKGPGLFEGFSIAGNASITARKNQVSDFGSSGDHCYSVSGIGGHTVEDNRAKDCQGDGINVASTGHTIQNNQVLNTLEDGIEVVNGTNVTILGNKVTGALGVGLQIEGSTGTVADGNKLSKVRLGICDEGTGTVLGSGNVTKNAHLPDQINTPNSCPID